MIPSGSSRKKCQGINCFTYSPERHNVLVNSSTHSRPMERGGAGRFFFDSFFPMIKLFIKEIRTLTVRVPQGELTTAYAAHTRGMCVWALPQLPHEQRMLLERFGVIETKPYTTKVAFLNICWTVCANKSFEKLRRPFAQLCQRVICEMGTCVLTMCIVYQILYASYSNALCFRNWAACGSISHSLSVTLPGGLGLGDAHRTAGISNNPVRVRILEGLHSPRLAVCPVSAHFYTPGFHPHPAGLPRQPPLPAPPWRNGRRGWRCSSPSTRCVPAMANM